MRHRTVLATLAAVLTVGGAVAVTSATTSAWFSDTASGADLRAGAATVALGRGGGTVELGYPDLRPGRRQIVDLTISYQGNVPADITLEIAPSGSSALCVQRDGRWRSRPGGAVTVAIGTAAAVSYCELLNGGALPLASAVPPGSERHIDVAVMLGKDADDDLRGLAERDVVTVRARGGFTDHVVGTISITTAGRDQDEVDDRHDDASTKDVVPGANGVAIPESSLQNPSLSSGELPTHPPVILPAECRQAGMRLDGFEDVIVLGSDQHTWSVLEQRGQDAGPFLVMGADGDDEIIGSAGADCIVGGGGRGKLSGGAGNDVVIGGEGPDQLDGGPGDDWLFSGRGVDQLRGGGGTDRFDGGPDGAYCDAGHDDAGAVRCQAPASSSFADGKKYPSAGGAISPPMTSPPTMTSPPVTSPPTTSSSTPTSSPASTVAAPSSTSSAPSTASPAQDDPSNAGTTKLSAPSDAGDDRSVTPTEASAPSPAPADS